MSNRIRYGGKAMRSPFRRLRQAHCNYYRTILGDPLRPVQGRPLRAGLSAPIAAARRYRCDPCRLRPLARAARFACRSGRKVEGVSLPTNDLLCHACSLHQPRPEAGSSAGAPAATRNETALAAPSPGAPRDRGSGPTSAGLVPHQAPLGPCARTTRAPHRAIHSGPGGSAARA